MRSNSCRKQGTSHFSDQTGGLTTGSCDSRTRGTSPRCSACGSRTSFPSSRRPCILCARSTRLPRIAYWSPVRAQKDGVPQQAFSHSSRRWRRPAEALCTASHRLVLRGRSPAFL
eukprot:Amastigsp_a677266_105.p3 type:complete len:115 gc:universal Amastigsp_a677266_105:340-684(+)